MNDERIIKMYKEGYTIEYITKVYYKYKNRNKKPITLNNIVLYPTKLFSRSDCRLYVIEVIYRYLINKDDVQTQTFSLFGRGAI